MTHPVVYVVGLGVALGCALFLYFSNSGPHQEQPRRPPSRPPRSPAISPTNSRRRRSRSQPYNEECSICMSTAEQLEFTTLPCQHQFHKKCIETLQAHHFRSCPNCRQPFST